MMDGDLVMDENEIEGLADAEDTHNTPTTISELVAAAMATTALAQASVNYSPHSRFTKKKRKPIKGKDRRKRAKQSRNSKRK